jgi:hypothetical protein
MGMRSVRDVLLEHGVAEVADWSLHFAMAVSANGRVIVGLGSTPTRIEGWRAFIPDLSPLCVGDLDGDQDVDLGDLAQMIAHFGTAGGAISEHGDTDTDGDVDLMDVQAMLAAYGAECGE